MKRRHLPLAVLLLCLAWQVHATSNCAPAAEFQILTEDRKLADAIAASRSNLERQEFFRDLSAIHEHLEMFGDVQSLRQFYRWARADGFQFCDYQDFVAKQTLLRPFPTLQGGLDHFLFDVIPLYAKVIGKSPARIEEWTYLAVLAADRQNITRLALRFSPGFWTSVSGMSWDDALNAVLKGMSRGLLKLASEGRSMQLQLYQIATREMSGSDNSGFIKNVDFFLKNRKYLAAFDIAGSELLAPIAGFKTALLPLIAEKAKDADIHFTFHAGEEKENASRSMIDAIEAGATRLGHGINGGDDEALKQIMAERKISIEVCPTSNVIVGVVPSFSEHPLPYLMQSHARPSISTDDPLTFSVVARAGGKGKYMIRPLSLWDEYARLSLSREQGGMGLSDAQLNELKDNGKEQFENFQPKTRPTLNELLCRLCAMTK